LKFNDESRTATGMNPAAPKVSRSGQGGTAPKIP